MEHQDRIKPHAFGTFRRTSRGIRNSLVYAILRVLSSRFIGTGMVFLPVVGELALWDS